MSTWVTGGGKKSQHFHGYHHHHYDITTGSAVSLRPWNVFNNTHLHKNSEENDSDDSCDKHVPHREVVLVKQVGQGESDCSSQATIRYDELVLGGELYYAESVDHAGQTDDP